MRRVQGPGLLYENGKPTTTPVPKIIMDNHDDDDDDDDEEICVPKIIKLMNHCDDVDTWVSKINMIMTTVLKITMGIVFRFVSLLLCFVLFCICP